LSNAISVLGVAAGPALMGVLFDALDYRLAYLAAVCGSVLAFLLLLGAGPGPVPRQGSRRSGAPDPAAE
jgi:predicted MFS family arabinose efflux permease